MFRRFLRPQCKNLKTLRMFLIVLRSSKSGVASSWHRPMLDGCGITFFTCWRLRSGFQGEKTEKWLGIPLNWSLKFKMGCSFPFEYANWAELHFLPLGHLRSGFQGEKIEKWLSRSANWPSACKKTCSTACFASGTPQKWISRREGWKMTFKDSQLTFSM